MKKMRVLYFVGGNDDKYGAQILATEIVSLMQRRHEVEYCVVTAKEGRTNRKCSELGIENYTSCYKYSTYYPLQNPCLNVIKRTVKRIMIDFSDKKAIYKIEKEIDVSSFDIIHANINRDMIGGYFSRKYDIPHVWHLQEMYDSHFGLKTVRKKQLEWMNNNCDQYIAISNTVANDWITHGLMPSKMNTIYNGIQLDNYKQRQISAKDSQAIRFVMAGVVCKEKGQEQLIDAIASLPMSIQHRIEIDFYGGGKEEYLNYLIEKVSKYKLDKQISFMGYRDNISEVLYKYDVGVNCSKGEGFGLSTVEFMASRLCVLVSNCGANTELIHDQQNGLVFEYGCPKSLADCIEELYLDPEKRNRLMRNAYNSSLKYSISECVDGIYQVYERLNSKRKRKNEAII